jgi:hypothetical protein
LGHTDVGDMYFSKNDNLQLTTMRWLLTLVRLEGCHLLLDVLFLCLKDTVLDLSDDGLDGMRKNPYRYNV